MRLYIAPRSAFHTPVKIIGKCRYNSSRYRDKNSTVLTSCYMWGFQSYSNSRNHPPGRSKKGSKTTTKVTTYPTTTTATWCALKVTDTTCVCVCAHAEWHVRPNNGLCNSFSILGVWRTEGANGITVYVIPPSPRPCTSCLMKSISRFMSPCKLKKVQHRPLLGRINVNNHHGKNNAFFVCLPADFSVQARLSGYKELRLRELHTNQLANYTQIGPLLSVHTHTHTHTHTHIYSLL